VFGMDRIPFTFRHHGQEDDYQDQLDEISYRIRALDPDLMSDEQFDEQVRG
jgi:hypothetical protein